MRKGIAESTLVVILVFIAVMVILLLLYNAVFPWSAKQFTIQQCRSSLLLTRAVDYPQACMVKFDNPVPINCERNFLLVSDKGVVKNGKDATAEYSAACPQGGNCLTKATVAEEMRTCWSEFNEGQVPVLQQAEGGAVVLSWTWNPNSKRRACFVCAEVTVNSSADVTGFKEYLKSAQLPTGKSYYDYFTDPKALCAPDIRKSGTCWEGVATAAPGDHPPIDQDTIKAGVTYAVVFMRHGIGPCAKDNTRGDPVSQTVQVIPAANISQQCDAVIV